ncbi:hypothetical protein LguiB_034065 [Lonicera macranthoides]
MRLQKAGVFRERKRKTEKATCSLSFYNLENERDKKKEREKLVCTDGARGQSRTIAIFIREMKQCNSVRYSNNNNNN